jgi:predicted transcriptional regulator
MMEDAASFRLRVQQNEASCSYARLPIRNGNERSMRVGVAEKIQRVTVNLTPKEDAALRRFAEDRQVSHSWVARMAIVEYLERHAGPQSTLPLTSAKAGRR